MIEISEVLKKVSKKQILDVLESKYSTMGPMWVNHQMQWCNGVYACFKDHDKFLIIIFLISKTLDSYSKNFTKFNYNQFYSKDTVEIELFTITEISKALNIPKESTRRKILELEEIGALRRLKKKIIIDRSKFYYSKPIDSIKRISRFLSTLSELCINSKSLSRKLTSVEFETVIKDNFTYIWKIYYELQIPMLINYKKIFGDLESFHIFATCVVNQHLYARKITTDYVSKNIFIESIYSAQMMQGLNAMSISDITGIPRATVIRKLRKLVIKKQLKIDNKKHYRLTDIFANKLKPLQNKNFIKLSEFSTIVFNLVKL